MPRTAPGGFSLVEATVAQIHAAMVDGQLSAAGLVDRYLERIEAFDAELHAILSINDAARERARRLDRHLDSEGVVGPFHGIPIILKDNHATNDLPTTAGSLALADAIPPRDAFVVDRLRNAGGIVLAKANLQELSYGVDTMSSLGGETRNAYDTGRRPAGSSGGTAAAIAANLGAVGTGSDTCSSVRSPPAFHALVGVRPTRGLVSRTGIVPLSETQDTAGPITRTVEDAARMLDVMGGYDPEDPVTARGVGQVPAGGYLAHLDTDGLVGARIGVARAFVGPQDEDSASTEDTRPITHVLDDAIGSLRAAGATVFDPVEVVDVDRLRSARVIRYEFARDFERYLSTFGEGAPYASLAELIASGAVHPRVAERLEAESILDVDIDALDGHAGYLRRLRRRRHLADAVLSRMADDDLDALLYPPSTIPPVELPERQPFSEMNCELAANTGLPAIVVPAGFTDDGLPVGLELLGRPFDETRLFELAYALEQTTEHRQPPDRFGTLYAESSP